jgi:hypothetical protein
MLSIREVKYCFYYSFLKTEKKLFMNVLENNMLNNIFLKKKQFSCKSLFKKLNIVIKKNITEV